jgi:tRNA pseudouridine55 synthase
MFGLLNLHKPSGITSRRVVDQVQRFVRPHKVGHAGTLDPLASGVLVLGLGPATRLVEYVQKMPKSYRAEFLLGRTSTTEDVEGEITVLADAPRPSREALQQAAATLTGTIEQRPPAYSALKVSGQRAYALARAGQAVELSARPIRVDRIEILRYEYPELSLDIECGSGTYVRSLGRDLAELTGTGAVMSALVRTAIGPFTLDDAVMPADLTIDNLTEHLLPAVLAVRGLFPERYLEQASIDRLRHGLSIELENETSESVAALHSSGQLIAILSRRDEGSYVPSKNFSHQ